MISFSIRDLENLSGIKAHTIRIWEKRYKLLSPKRTTTNIRTYNLANLQKLLNITLLYNSGIKISKIAKIPADEIALAVYKIGSKSDARNHAVNAFKFAMINFDQALFRITYDDLISKTPFRLIFWEIFIPLLEELGLLWQTDTISPAHEHFITHLIKQKILIETDLLQAVEPSKSDKIFALFLPQNEIHEIGLLFIYYELTWHGFKTIYLGQNMPVDHLIDLQNFYGHMYFISYFTVVPTRDKLTKYITAFDKKLNAGGGREKSQLWILGRQMAHLNKSGLPSNVRSFESIHELQDALT